MYTVNDVKEIVESEGLAYAITSYINSDKIEDEKLREMFKKADKILSEIERYIEANAD